MKLILIVFLFSTSIGAQNMTASKPLSCHLAEGSKTLLQGSVVTGSIVLSYINAILPIVAEVVVAAIMRKLTTKSPEEGSGDGDTSPGTVIPVDAPLTASSADLLAWYDRVGLSLFAAHASTSLPRVSQVFGNTFAKTGPEAGPSTPSATTILTLGSAVIAVMAGAAYPMLNGWCRYESH